MQVRCATWMVDVEIDHMLSDGDWPHAVQRS